MNPLPVFLSELLSSMTLRTFTLLTIVFIVANHPFLLVCQETRFYLAAQAEISDPLLLASRLWAESILTFMTACEGAGKTNCFPYFSASISKNSAFFSCRTYHAKGRFLSCCIEMESISHDEHLMYLDIYHTENKSLGALHDIGSSRNMVQM